MFIAAECDWQILSAQMATQTDDAVQRRGSNQVNEFEIVITVSKRQPAEKFGYQDSRSTTLEINEYSFNDDAFARKTYKVKLEEGNFVPDFDSWTPKSGIQPQRYSLRLTFDKSPYPLRHE